MNNKVSVIIVNYNGLEHIDGCVASVLKQGYENREIIFVDNASDDGSLEYVKRRYPSLIVASNDRNLGYAGGLNAGLKEANGRYIAPLNVDTEVDPSWLGEMVGFMENRIATVGAVTPKIMLHDEGHKVNAMGLNIHISGLGFCRGLGGGDSHGEPPCAEIVPGVSGCSYLIPKDRLEEMEGFPEWTFMGNDDVIVSWLLRLMGYEIYCVNESVAYHKYKLRMTPRKFYELERGRESLLLSTLKPWTMVAMFPVLLGVEAMVLAYSLLKGKDYAKSKMGAWLYLWREREKIKGRRRQYQSLRKVSDWSLFRGLCWNLNWKQLWGVSASSLIAKAHGFIRGHPVNESR